MLGGQDARDPEHFVTDSKNAILNRQTSFEEKKG
jgi:hypothetical protein